MATDRKKAIKRKNAWAAVGRFFGLLILLGVIGAGVYALLQYHNGKSGQYQNELFFGDMPEEEDGR